MRNLEIKNKNESGRSMIEMLGVLAIIGVLSVGGIAGYSKAMQKYRINKSIEQITLIAGNVREFFAPQKNYDGLKCSCSNGSCKGQSTGDGCPVVKKAKILPDEMLSLDANGKIIAITNPFGYDFSLFAFQKSKSSDPDFGFSYYIGDNIEACIELVSQDWRNANIRHIIVVGNGSAGTISRLNDIPVSVDVAVQSCSDMISAAKAANISSYITFYF